MGGFQSTERKEVLNDEEQWVSWGNDYWFGRGKPRNLEEAVPNGTFEQQNKEMLKLNSTWEVFILKEKE